MLTKGCKIWLWIIFIGSVISIVTGFAAFSISFIPAVITIVLSIILMLGIGLMLFKQKKEGFYIQCGVSVGSFILNMTQGTNLIFALISAVLSPIITYYFVFVKNGLTGGFVQPVNSGYSGSDSTTSTYASSNTSENNSTHSDSQTSQESSSEKNTFEKTMNDAEENANFMFSKKMNVSVDLYKELDIDRAWDEKSIRNHLKGLQKLWTQRQGATNDKEQLLLIDTILKFVEDGYRYLTKAIKRKQYDKALEIAYKAGKIADEAEEKLNSLLEKARAFYRKGKLQMAAQFAKEAVDGKVNDPSAYDLLARCYFEMDSYDKAISVIDQGLGVFAENIELCWLSARIATVGTKNYDDAQRRVNNLISMAPDKSIGHAEQIYLHLRKGDEALAFQEIDSYIEKNPSDDDFKKDVAYDLDSYSNSYYYYDAALNATFIADKKSYDKCLMLRTKAVNIFDDEHTQNQLENAKYFGKKEWNDWNMSSIKSLALYGTIFMILEGMSGTGAFGAIGLVLLVIMGILIYFSFRPYWQINKTYVTGQMGKAEQIVNQLGDLATRAAIGLLRLIYQLVIWILKFIIGLASGKWFR